MKQLAIICLLAFTLVGCNSIKETVKKADPTTTGEIIGFAYLLTKDELADNDRKNIEQAYAVFSEVVSRDAVEYSATVNVKEELFKALDRAMDKPEDQAKKAAIKIIVSTYWSKVNSEYSIDLKLPAEQLAILKQVHIGIERGLGKAQ